MATDSGGFSRRQQLIVLAAAFLSLALVPVLLRFETTHAGWNSENSAALMSMDKAERDRVEHNFERFQALDAKRQEGLRDLHDEVSTDPELAASLDTYLKWLDGLELYQRYELRDAEDRIDRVADYRAQQEYEAESFELSRDFVRQFGRWPQSLVARLDDQFPLTIRHSELDRMLEPIKEALEASPSGHPRPPERELPGGASRSRIIMHVLQRTGGGGFGGPDGPRQDRQPDWLDDDLCTAVFGGLEDSELRESLNGLTLDGKRRVLRTILMGGGFASAFGRFRELDKYRPAADQLSEFYAEIDDAKLRSELLKLPPERARTRLERMYIAQDATAPAAIREFAEEVIDKGYTRFRRSRRPGSDPQRGGFDGRRGGSGPGGPGGGRSGRPDRGPDGRGPDGRAPDGRSERDGRGSERDGRRGPGSRERGDGQFRGGRGGP